MKRLLQIVTCFGLVSLVSAGWSFGQQVREPKKEEPRKKEMLDLNKTVQPISDPNREYKNTGTKKRQMETIEARKERMNTVKRGAPVAGDTGQRKKNELTPIDKPWNSTDK